MLPPEHSAILLTCIKWKSVLKILSLSSFAWPLKTDGMFKLARYVKCMFRSHLKGTVTILRYWIHIWEAVLILKDFSLEEPGLECLLGMLSWVLTKFKLLCSGDLIMITFWQSLSPLINDLNWAILKKMANKCLMSAGICQSLNHLCIFRKKLWHWRSTS